MKYTTQELYLCEPEIFRTLPYEDALNKKIEQARFAMNNYADVAREFLSNDTKRYEKFLKKYLASENAMKHNRDLIDELNGIVT